MSEWFLLLSAAVIVGALGFFAYALGASASFVFDVMILSAVLQGLTLQIRLHDE